MTAVMTHLFNVKLLLKKHNHQKKQRLTVFIDCISAVVGAQTLLAAPQENLTIVSGRKHDAGYIF